MMLYWELFTVFFKIGLFSFGGGLAMISIIQQEVVGRGWIPAAEYARIITISQITPGPIAVNTATYVGARVCGPEFWHALLGSFVATFSVSLPSFILVAIVARSLQKFNSSLAVQGILNGLRPSVIALMLTAVFFFMRITFFPAAGTAAMENLLTYFKFWPTLLTALLFYLHYYRNLSAIPLMLLAGCAGLFDVGKTQNNLHIAGYFISSLIFAAQRNGFGRAGLPAFTAGNTFPVAYPFTIHQAAAYAALAGGTFTRIYLHPKNGDPVKQAVKSSQGTEKTAKRPIDKQRCCSQKTNDPTPVQTIQIKEIQITGKQQQNHIFKIT